MKRYLVFTGACYYARGGADDFHSDHSSITAASIRAEALLNDDNDWSHVWDSQTRKIIKEFGERLYQYDQDDQDE